MFPLTSNTSIASLVIEEEEKDSNLSYNASRKEPEKTSWIVSKNIDSNNKSWSWAPWLISYGRWSRCAGGGECWVSQWPLKEGIVCCQGHYVPLSTQVGTRQAHDPPRTPSPSVQCLFPLGSDGAESTSCTQWTRHLMAINSQPIWCPKEMVNVLSSEDHVRTYKVWALTNLRLNKIQTFYLSPSGSNFEIPAIGGIERQEALTGNSQLTPKTKKNFWS